MKHVSKYLYSLLFMAGDRIYIYIYICIYSGSDTQKMHDITLNN
jgi:hypothetical protein